MQVISVIVLETTEVTTIRVPPKITLQYFSRHEVDLRVGPKTSIRSDYWYCSGLAPCPIFCVIKFDQ